MTLTVHELMKAMQGRLISGRPQTSCRRVSIDTRTIQPGDVFFAIHGPRFDGHDFIRAAADRGAAVVVIDRLDERLRFSPGAVPDVVLVQDSLAGLQALGNFCRQKSQAVVIGLTGSNGKTTTKEMLAAILRQAGPTLSTRGNLNNHIGLPLMLTELEDQHRFALLELGTSMKGDMDVLLKILEPSVGVITNVGKDHLEFLGTPEGVLEENRPLVDRLPKEGAAILNQDDPLLSNLKPRSSCRVITFGEDTTAEVRATNIEAAGVPIRFRLHYAEGVTDVVLNVPGRFQISNALTAAATALALHIPIEKIVQGLATFKPAKMRMELNERPDGSLLINDAYNANPSSVQASVASFCESYATRPRWLVLGDMRELGAIARDEHRAMGAWLAKQPLDRIFLYGRDTRFVLEGHESAGGRATIERFRKKRYLIEALERSLPNKRPAVLFKASRSLKLEQVILPLTSSNCSGAMASH
jgi:UDP-N-acetylmuramoyl-tripeptide--D-alanyl-D-alanine ligase